MTRTKGLVTYDLSLETNSLAEGKDTARRVLVALRTDFAYLLMMS